MSLGENIQFYRKKGNITQEQLAERLDLSRQSISKWESNTTYPEMDKLLQMCDMFSCSLDTLLRGDAESTGAEDTTNYDRHMNGFGLAISIGTGLLFVGISVLLSLLGIGVTAPLSVVAMLVFVIAGILIMTSAGLGHDAYTKKHPNIKPFYSEEETEKAEQQFRILITFSIGLLLCGVLWLVGSFAIPIPEGFSRHLYVAGATFIAGIAIALMSYSGLQRYKHDIDDYNAKNEPEAKRAEKQREENSPVGKWCGSVFMLSIASYLVCGFVWQLWSTAWVVFPIAIFLCAIGSLVGSTGAKPKV